jgi:hypothetical protein
MNAFLTGAVIPRHGSWRVHVSTGWQVAATWQAYPAAMHDGVLCFCPAMHGGVAKWPRFEIFFVNRVKFGICSKFGLKIKKNSHPFMYYTT